MWVSCVDEALLKGVDLVITAGPDVLRDQIVDADDQHVLVVRAVEDHNFSPGRRGPVRPPQEIVGQFLGRGLAERRHPATLGVHRPQDVADRPVLSARVHCLQADQQRLASLRIEQRLEFPEPFLELCDLLIRRLVILVTVLESRIGILELTLLCQAAL